MSRRFDFYLSSRKGLTGNRTGRETHTGRSRHSPHWAQEINESGNIIRPHVEHGSAAFFIIKSRIGMPRFMPVTEHEGRSGNRFSNQPIIKGFAAGLNSTSQESVWRAAHAQIFASGEIE